MTLIEATVTAAAHYPTPAVRAQVIALLMTGQSDLCDDCGFIKAAGTVCEVCESAWADEQAEKEEELSWGRAAMLAPRF